MRAAGGARAGYWGAAFLLVGAVRIVLKFLNHSGLIVDLPHLARIQYPLGLATPALIYLYVLYLLEGSRRSPAKEWPHFLPAVAVAAYLTPYYTATGAVKVAAMIGVGPLPRPMPSGYNVAGILYSVIYLAMTYGVLRRFLRRHDRKSLSGAGKEVVSWVRLVIIGGAVFMVTAIVMRLMVGVVDLNYFLFQVFSMMMIAICVKLLLLPTPVFAPQAAARKYAKSSLGEEERRGHAQALTELLTAKELFRKNDLRPADLAAEMGVPEYVVSQVVNEEFGRTFNDLIREHRIRAARAHLADPAFDHYSMEAIGHEVGFRARASFYAAFKELTGSTPSEFRKAHSPETD